MTKWCNWRLLLLLLLLLLLIWRSMMWIRWWIMLMICVTSITRSITWSTAITIIATSIIVVTTARIIGTSTIVATTSGSMSWIIIMMSTTIAWTTIRAITNIRHWWSQGCCFWFVSLFCCGHFSCVLLTPLCSAILKPNLVTLKREVSKSGCDNAFVVNSVYKAGQEVLSRASERKVKKCQREKRKEKKWWPGSTTWQMASYTRHEWSSGGVKSTCTSTDTRAKEWWQVKDALDTHRHSWSLAHEDLLLLATLTFQEHRPTWPFPALPGTLSVRMSSRVRKSGGPKRSVGCAFSFHPCLSSCHGVLHGDGSDEMLHV